MCCTWLAGNTGHKNDAKSRHHLTTLSAISSQLRHVSTIGKKLVKQQYLHMSSQYGELRPTSSWDRFVSLGHPIKFQFQWLSCLGIVTARHSSTGRQPNFAALNRGRPSRWALAHILVSVYFKYVCVPDAWLFCVVVNLVICVSVFIVYFCVFSLLILLVVFSVLV